MTEERDILAEREKFWEWLHATYPDRELELPKAIVVRIEEVFEIPARKPHEGVAVLSDGNGARWRVAVRKRSFERGERCVFIQEDQCVRERAVLHNYAFGFRRYVFYMGKGETQLSIILLKANRSNFKTCNGVLFPLSAFKETVDQEVGTDVSRLIGAMSRESFEKYSKLHWHGLLRLEADSAVGDERRIDELSEMDAKMSAYHKARTFRANCSSAEIGDAPRFVGRTRLEDLSVHPEYFSLYRDLLFDVSEKHKGINLSVYYSPGEVRKIHVCLNGRELDDDGNNFFWNLIKRQRVDQGLINAGCEYVLEGVVTGPSICGGLFDGETSDNFRVFDVFDIASNRSLRCRDRVGFCAKYRIHQVKMLATGVPLFAKCPSVESIRQIVEKPGKDGRVRHGLVFRSAFRGQNVAFELINQSKEVDPMQKMIDGQFDIPAKSEVVVPESWTPVVEGDRGHVG